jgi:hypothetical protein
VWTTLNKVKHDYPTLITLKAMHGPARHIAQLSLPKQGVHQIDLRPIGRNNSNIGRIER